MRVNQLIPKQNRAAIVLLFTVFRFFVYDLKAQSSKMANDTIRLNAYCTRALDYAESNRDKSIYYGVRALEIARKLNQPFYESSILCDLGYTQLSNGDYSQALNNLLLANKLVEDKSIAENVVITPFFKLFFKVGKPEENRLRLFIYIKSNLALLYGKTRNPRKQIEVLTEARTIVKSETNDPKQLYSLTTNLVDAYLEINNLDSALRSQKEVLDIDRNINSQVYEGAAQSVYASIFLKKGKTDSARKYYMESLRILKAKGENITFLASTYFGLSQVYKALGKADSSLFFANASIKAYRQLGASVPELADSYNALSISFSDKHQYDSAFFYNHLAKQLSDSLHEKEIKDLARFQNIGFEELLRLKEAESEMEATKSEREILALLIGLVAALAVSLLLYRNNRQRQKANRELEIESSLERVRSMALSMKQPVDMLEVCRIICKQLELLNVRDIRNVQSAIFYESRGTYMNYEYYSKHDRTFVTEVDFRNHPIQSAFAEKMMKGPNEEVLEHLTGKELQDWYEYQKTTNQFADNYLLNAQSLNYYWYSLGPVALGCSTYYPLIEKEIILFKRFLKVFEIAYRRYLDIEMAYSQAKEARIETALERVRAVAMAMKKSDELASVSEVMFKELVSLGFANIRNAQIAIENEEKQIFTTYVYSENDKQRVSIAPLSSSKLLLQAKEKLKNSSGFYEAEFSGVDLEEWREWKRKINNPMDEKELYATSMRWYLYSLGKGHLGISTFDSVSEEEIEIVKRFKNVFELCYTRFEDLQKAEAQAKEAQIEGALERVRSRTLAMHKSSELSEAAAVMFRQLIQLGIEPNRLFIILFNNDNPNCEAWLTDEDGSKVSKGFTGNYERNASLRKMYEGWRQGQKSQVIDMQGEELQNYFHYLNDELKVPFKNGLSQKRRLQNLAYFSYGLIGIASPEPLPDENRQLLERFAAVFNLTYTRFNDLQIAEANSLQAEQDLIAIKEAKHKAEEALTELKETQKQLIQSEKMASLGELTAGIAHEIQNPLNFVNNFSEVSNELLDEMNTELEKGDLEEVKAIAGDIKVNLEKINHHGKRAGAIVKGMLQHSRTSTGQKEPTNINALCDEYFRLSYHGLRAKDKSFNVGMKMDFDPELPEVNVISQDVGRVILNLLTNAFYAVNERLRLAQPESDSVTLSQSKGYEPTVCISTKKLGDKVEIRISDNGPGISQKILDKIFQPFFTTKPTGQGTGLGLSLSYDIISKGHGGELKVETEEGAGTTFIIQLPVV